MQDHYERQDAALTEDTDRFIIPIAELLGEAVSGKEPRKRNPRQTRQYTVVLLDRTRNEIVTRGPHSAKNENHALLKAFGRMPTKKNRKNPVTELQRLLFEVGAFTITR